MVARMQFNEVPPRVEYSLTKKGLSVVPVLSAIAAWATEHNDRAAECSARCDTCQAAH